MDTEKEKQIGIIETHVHLDDEAFDVDRQVLIDSLHDAGVLYAVNIASDIESSRAGMALAHTYPHIYAAVGIHPTSTGELGKTDIETLREMARDEKVVAIGEIGLDYYWDSPDREIQKHWFREQLSLAKELDMPVVIHSRDAAKDTYDIIKKSGHRHGVIHSYSYSIETAKEFLKLGFMLGIGGVITFKNAKKIKEVLEEISFADFVLETDSPYLAPVPHRGKRNTPKNLSYIVREIAMLKGVSEAFVIEKTFENARKLYPKLR